MHWAGLNASLIAGLALLLAGCITTTPGSEAGMSERRQWEATCQARGLRPNTPGFQGCVSNAAAGRGVGTWVGVGW